MKNYVTTYTVGLADTLRKNVLVYEAAEEKALHASTDQLIQGLSCFELVPELTEIEMRAFISEAERRIRDAESARGGH